MEEFFALPPRLPAALLAFFGAFVPLLPRASAPPLSAAGGSSSDPFAPGLRWSRGASPDAPWIPRDLVLVGDGELLWTAPAGGRPSLALYATAALEDPVAPLFEDLGPAEACGVIRVAAGDDARELYALVQLPGAQAPERRRVVTRHDAVAAATGAGFGPLWSHELGQEGNGNAFLAVDETGGAIVAAAFDATLRQARVERLDPTTGVPTAVVDLPALALRRLAVSADGRRVVVLTGPDAVVLDGDLVVRTTVPLSGAGAGAAFDATGERLALGSGDAVLLVEDANGTWTTRTVTRGGPDEIAVETALSADGSVLAVTWWNAVTGVDVRCEILNPLTGRPRGEWIQTAPPGSLQNYPQALAITPGGERVAVGVWGVGDARPEVVLLEPGAAAPLFEVDLPGSVQALALDPTGTRIAVGMKDTHANLFSTTGAVREYDTGERDLQLVGAVRSGGRLELALAPPPATAAVVAVGFPLDTPVSAPGWGGELWLDDRRPIAFFGGVPDSAGRVGWGLDVPSDPGLVGLETVIQAVSVGVGGGLILAATVVRPPVL